MTAVSLQTSCKSPEPTLAGELLDSYKLDSSKFQSLAVLTLTCLQVFTSSAGLSGLTSLRHIHFFIVVEEIQCSAPHVQSCQDSHVTYQALAMYIPNLRCIFRIWLKTKECVSILLLRCFVLLSLLTELAV